MIRSVAPVRRRPNLDWAEFSRHWREEHAAIARRMAGMTGYVQGHVHPEDQPPGRPDDWAYDGVPFAAFPDIAAIEEMRTSPDYQAMAVPDEEAFLDRSAMAAVLLVDSFGGPPADELGPDSRTLLVLTRGAGTGEAAGRALLEALVPMVATSIAHRWSVALDSDPRLSPASSVGRPFDGLLELWFPDGADATRAADGIVAGDSPLFSDVFCLVVRENVVIGLQ